MDIWSVLWTTSIATLIGSFPAVIFGVVIGVRIDRRRIWREAQAGRRQYFSRLRESGGILYQARDWARSIQISVQANSGAGVAPLQRHSTSSLRWFMDAGRVPEEYETDFHAMIGLADRLHLVVDSRLGVAIPVPLDQLAYDDATELAQIADALIQHAQQAV